MKVNEKHYSIEELSQYEIEFICGGSLWEDLAYWAGKQYGKMIAHFTMTSKKPLCEVCASQNNNFNKDHAGFKDT